MTNDRTIAAEHGRVAKRIYVALQMALMMMALLCSITLVALVILGVIRI